MAKKNASGAAVAVKTKSSRAWVPVVIVVAALAVLLGAAVAVTLFDGKIHPKVYVGNVAVGRMTVAEATDVIQDSLRSLDPVENLTIRLQDKSYTIDAKDIENSRNPHTLALEAYSCGRSGSLPERVMSRFGLMGPVSISDSVFISEEFLRQVVDSLLTERMDGSYAISGNRLTVTTGIDGITADLDDVVSDISRRYEVGDYSDYVVEAVLDKAEQPDLEAIYEELCTPAKDAYYDPETHQVVSEVAGYEFDLAQAKQALESADPGETLFFSLKNTAPAVTAEQIWEQLFENELYSYTTSLVNIPNRTNNVTLAAKAIDGTIVMPGETFSFNKVVGERTAAKGYKEADVYVSGNTVGELGGGVCQVASTIYVCSLYLDLEIVERGEHQFYVTYVPSGLDATIYWGQHDYKFKNNTDYPIKISAGVEGLALTVTFYGVKANDNYVKMVSETLAVYPFETIEQVDETKPVGYSEVKQTGYTGYKVRTTRNVYDGEGNLISSKVEAVSNYSRRDKIVIVGPKETPETPGIPSQPEGPGIPETPETPVTPPAPPEQETQAPQVPNETNPNNQTPAES